jgi:hypothetical protein
VTRPVFHNPEELFTIGLGYDFVADISNGNYPYEIQPLLVIGFEFNQKAAMNYSHCCHFVFNRFG